MIELTRKDSDYVIKSERENKTNKHEYKTNLSISIWSLKHKKIILILEASPWKRNIIYKDFMKQVTKRSILILPDRQNPDIKRIAWRLYYLTHLTHTP